MKIKLFILTGIMGIAVITGIIKGLSSARSRPGEHEDEGEVAGEKEGRSGEKTGSIVQDQA